MPAYHIYSQSGDDFGLWNGLSAAHALADMHREAGYADVRVGPFGDIIWPDEETQRVCGDLVAEFTPEPGGST